MLYKNERRIVRQAHQRDPLARLAGHRGPRGVRMASMIIVTYYISVLALFERALRLLCNEPIAVARTLNNAVRPAILENGIRGGGTDDRKMVVVRLVRGAGKNVFFVVVAVGPRPARTAASRFCKLYAWPVPFPPACAGVCMAARIGVMASITGNANPHGSNVA